MRSDPRSARVECPFPLSLPALQQVGKCFMLAAVQRKVGLILWPTGLAVFGTECSQAC